MVKNIKAALLFVGFVSCTLNGMNEQQEPKKQLSSIIYQVSSHAMSQLSFIENERVLHLGLHYEGIIQRYAPKVQVDCTGVDQWSNIEKFDWILGDSKATKYDKVLSFADWDMIKNSEKAVVATAALLKSNGQFCVVVPHNKSLYLDTHYKTLTSDKWKDCCDRNTIIELFCEQEIKNIITKSGFDNVECTVVKKPFKFATKEKFIAWIASSKEQLDGIPQERQQEFINDVVANYLNYPVTKKNIVLLYLPYMIIKGSKK